MSELRLDIEEPPAYTEPRFPWLFDLVIEAARDAVEAARRRIKRLGFTPPSAHYPSLGHFAEGGMPDIDFGTRLDVPNYRYLWGTTDEQEPNQVDVRIIPSFIALLAAVRLNAEVSAAIGFPSDSPELQSFVEVSLTTGVYELPLSLAERFLIAHRDADVTPAALLDDYLRLEAGIALDVLEVDAVLPIIATAFDVDEYALDSTTRIVRMPELFQLSRVPGFSVDGVAERCLVSAATHAIVFERISFPNRGKWLRATSYIENYPVARFEQAFAALRTASPETFGSTQIAVRARGWAGAYNSDLLPLAPGPELKWYPAAMTERGWLDVSEPVTEDELAIASSVYQGLQAAHERVRLAGRKLNEATLRDRQEDRILDVCTALEALLGGDHAEIGYKLRLRGAALLQLHPTAPQAATVSQWLKAIYDARSAVVHGSLKPTRPVTLSDGAEIPVQALSVYLLRLILQTVSSSEMLYSPSEAGKAIDEGVVFPAIDIFGLSLSTEEEPNA